MIPDPISKRHSKINTELAINVARSKESSLFPFLLDLTMSRTPHTPKIKLNSARKAKRKAKLPSSPSIPRELNPIINKTSGNPASAKYIFFSIVQISKKKAQSLLSYPTHYSEILPYPMRRFRPSIPDTIRLTVERLADNQFPAGGSGGDNLKHRFFTPLRSAQNDNPYLSVILSVSEEYMFQPFKAAR